MSSEISNLALFIKANISHLHGFFDNLHQHRVDDYGRRKNGFEGTFVSTVCQLLIQSEFLEKRKCVSGPRGRRPSSEPRDS